MSDFFSFSRFKHLMVNHLVENRKKYINYFLAAAISGIVVILLFILSGAYGAGKNYYDYNNEKGWSESNWDEFQYVIFFVGYFLFGGIFSINSFTDFNSKGEATFYMIKPASVFEKWLTEFFYRCLFFTIVYSLLYYLLVLIAHPLIIRLEYARYLEEKPSSPFQSSDIQNVFKPYFEFYIYAVYIFLISFIMYGRVLFTRYTFFKTLFLAFCIGISFMIYMLLIGNNIMYNDWEIRLFDLSANYYSSVNVSSKLVYFSEQFIENYMIVAGHVITVLVLMASYFKLKEKQL